MLSEACVKKDVPTYLLLIWVVTDGQAQWFPEGLKGATAIQTISDNNNLPTKV